MTRMFVRTAIAASLLVIGSTSRANAWEDAFQRWPGSETLIPSTVDPEVMPMSADPEQDMERMWRMGYAPYGYSAFESGNGKTSDAVKFARKLKARYVFINAAVTSSQTSSIPIRTPNSTTSITTGTANVMGSGGMATGNYSGTTTTYGTQTTYIPVTVERFGKIAAYFGEVPKYGAGIMPRELTQEEVSRLETRRAFAVRFVRDGSPAYYADILPGDLITQVNGQPYDISAWREATKSDRPFSIHIIRNGQPRDITLTIPVEWRPKD